jgi:hypothetical protein
MGRQKSAHPGELKITKCSISKQHMGELALIVPLKCQYPWPCASPGHKHTLCTYTGQCSLHAIAVHLLLSMGHLKPLQSDKHKPLAPWSLHKCGYAAAALAKNGLEHTLWMSQHRKANNPILRFVPEVVHNPENHQRSFQQSAGNSSLLAGTALIACTMTQQLLIQLPILLHELYTVYT